MDTLLDIGVYFLALAGAFTAGRWIEHRGFHPVIYWCAGAALFALILWAAPH